jgi:glycosyltransferase involved in cell wall biosynthesis
MSTVKVLHVIARMNVGGTARYVGDLVAKIPDSALATGFVQGSEIEDPIAQNLTTFRIPHMGRRVSPHNDLKAWLELRRIVREIKPEIVHTHTFKAGLIGRLVGGKHKRVHTFHGHLFDDQSFSPFEKRVITIAERYLAKRTDLLISVGERVGQELRRAGIGSTKKWESIAPGVEALPLIYKSEARKRLGLDPNVFLVGWMARMTGVKNPLLALEVAKGMPEVQFVMAGGGDLLEVVAKSAPSNVAVIGWTDASTFWSAVDCAFSTSDNEGMPIALIEAQLAGVPVVATNVGSNSEVIEDRVTGVLTGKDAASLIESLGSLVTDERFFKSLAEQTTSVSARKFSPTEMIDKHLHVYSELRT